VVKARRKIATVEEAHNLPEQPCAPSGPAIRIARTLHRLGLTIIVISIIDNINEFVADSRNLPKPHWLTSFGWVAPYSFWGKCCWHLPVSWCEIETGAGDGQVRGNRP
jgi:hypothetical protein